MNRNIYFANQTWSNPFRTDTYHFQAKRTNAAQIKSNRNRSAANTQIPQTRHFRPETYHFLLKWLTRSLFFMLFYFFPVPWDTRAVYVSQNGYGLFFQRHIMSKQRTYHFLHQPSAANRNRSRTEHIKRNRNISYAKQNSHFDECTTPPHRNIAFTNTMKKCCTEEHEQIHITCY